METETKLETMELTFETRAGLFSPRGADVGSLALLDCVQLEPGQKVLDLGCGWGLMGLCAAKTVGAENVWMTDIDPAACEMAARNAARNGFAEAHIQVSDGLRELNEAGFDWILSNPPYHTDFSVAKHFIEKGFNRLKLGGRMAMVTKRDKWYRMRFSAIFGGVKVIEKDGYFIFLAERRQSQWANSLKKAKG